MSLDLDSAQARVLGVLLEKEATTPDVYPLSLNAIVTACNQKTNRDPVMDFGEREVQDAVDALTTATLVRQASGAGGRVAKYAHRLDSRLFGELEFTKAEQAAVCVLLLRGPQTVGEIRTRAARLVNFENVQQTEAVLDRLARREDGPWVVELAREPGRRENRYAHLFCGEVAHQQARPDEAEPLRAPAGQTPSGDGGDRVAEMSRRLDRVEHELAVLTRKLAALTGGETPDSH